MLESKVSVIVPVYNTEAYIVSCVDSIINQTYKNIEIILVDDGSPDNCPALCDQIASEHNNVIVIHQENGGLSVARNKGLEVITGDYVMFLDSDDTIVPNAIEILLESLLSNNAQCSLSTKYYELAPEDGRRSLQMHFPNSKIYEKANEYALDVLILKSRAWRATTVLYKTSILQDFNITFPVDATSEDFTFNIKYLSCSDRVALCDEPILLYNRRMGSITRSFDKNYMNSIRIIQESANWFFDNNKLFESKREIAVNSLFCRNVVTYLFDTMSFKNKMNIKEKIKFASSEILTKETINRFNTDVELPYFSSKNVVLFYKIEYFLLKKHLCKMAILLARIAGLIK